MEEFIDALVEEATEATAVQEIQVPLTFEQKLNKLLARSIELNVFIHVCNKCHKYGQALHLENCLFCES